MRRQCTPDHERPSGPSCVVRAAILVAAGMVAAFPAPARPSDRPTPQGHYVFRSYGATDGLVYTAVLQLLQDRQGFIWTGTDDGVYRYDGYRFDSFGIDQGLPSAAVDALHEDRHGVLWVGTRAGLSHWDGIRFVSTPDAIVDGDVIQDLADNDEGLWLASTRGLFVAADDVRFRPAPGWNGGEATALWQGRKASGLWVAQWDGVARVFRRNAEGWRSYALLDAPVAERIGAIAEDRDGRLWARTSSQLWMLDVARAAFVRVETPIALAAQTRSYLVAGRRGDLWVPTNDVIAHRDGDRWTETLGGAVLGARPVLEDREGSLWFGVRGIQRLAGRGIFHAYDITEGLPGNVAWSIARDRDQTLWIGTERGLARAVGERFETIPGTESEVIRTIAAAPDGKLYLAGIPGDEVLIYDPATRQLKHHPLGLERLPTRLLHAVIDAQGMLWVSSDTAGLLKADTRDPALRFSREPLPAGTQDELVRGLHIDVSGRLWAAGRYGLALREDGQWRRFTRADGLRHSELAYVQSTRNGDLLVVYDGVRGFVRARYEGGALRIVRHVENARTRSADQIFVIGEDANANVWVGTGRGIDLMTRDRTEHFSAAHGLLGEDTASMAFMAEPNGDVWVGVVGGLMRFDAAAYAALPPRSAPSPGLLEVRVGDRQFAAAAPDVRVEHSANSFQVRYSALSYLGDDSIQYRTRLDGLEKNENVTESRDARYSALSPGHYRFEVAARVGTDGAWGAPATFAFQVLPAWWQTWWARVLFAVGVVLAVVLAVRWRLAALRQRNRALEDHVATRTVELSRANVQLQSEIDDRHAAERAVQQRNAELEDLNRKLAGTQSQLLQSEKMASVGQLAAGVAHEINNPIGFVHSNLGSLARYIREIFSVLGVYEKLESALPRDHPDIAELRAIKQRVELDYLRRDTDDLLAETMDGVTRVKKIVQDLKDFSHLDEAEWQRVDLHRGLDSTLNVVAHELKYKANVVKIYGDVPPVECLPFQLNQVFMNLLVNAAQAIDTQGTVTIRTGRDGGTAWIAISDTGRGIDPANLRRVFEPFFTTKPVGVGTGLGLSVSYGIVQKHGGTIDVTSEPGRGSTFTIRLPIDAVRRDAPAHETVGETPRTP